MYAHLLHHLDAAGRGAEAKATLLQLPWLQATLRERGLYALLRDVAERTAGDGTMSLLHRTLRLSAPGLQGSDAAEALPGQLVGRLGGLLDTASPEVVHLCEAARSWRGTLAWLRPVKPTLLAPVGALQLCLEGHTNSAASTSSEGGCFCHVAPTASVRSHSARDAALTAPFTPHLARHNLPQLCCLLVLAPLQPQRRPAARQRLGRLRAAVRA